MIISNHSELMKENQDDADRHDETDRKQPSTEERFTVRPFVGELIPHQPSVCKPAYQDAREEGSGWQHILSRQIVAELHQWQSQHLNIGICPNRKRTEHGYQRADCRQYPGSTLTRQMKLLMEEGRTNLMHGDGRGKGSEYQQGIEQYGNHVADGRHGEKRLLKHIRQGNEDERGATVGLYTH